MSRDTQSATQSIICRERHLGIAEQREGLAGIVEPGGRRLLPLKIGVLAEALCRTRSASQRTDMRLRPGDIERRGRAPAVAQRAQRHGVGVALPDDVDVPVRDVDRLAVANTCVAMSRARRSGSRSRSSAGTARPGVPLRVGCPTRTRARGRRSCWRIRPAASADSPRSRRRASIGTKG